MFGNLLGGSTMHEPCKIEREKIMRCANACFTFLLLMLPAVVTAEIYWDDSFEAPCGICKWTDYGLGHNHVLSSAEHYDGSQSLGQVYPHGGFLDRFLPQNRQFNIRVAMKLSAGWITGTPTESKIIYIRADQASGPQSPNGYLAMAAGVTALRFVLQGPYDRSDTELLQLGITLSSQHWTEIEFEWVMNNPGQADGSMTAWASQNGMWVRTFHQTGRQYKGPAQAGTFITNVRNYAQLGTGTIFLDKYAVGNSRIGCTGCPVTIPLTIGAIRLNTVVLTPYTDSLKASGGKAPYFWSITGNLPAGLSLKGNVISGIPSTIGSATFTAKVTDAVGATATKSYTIMVSKGTGIAGTRLAVNSLQLTAEPGRESLIFRAPPNVKASIEAFDLSGREVWRHTGSGEAVWNHGGKLRKGVYLVRTEQNGKTMKISYCHIW